MGIFGWLDPQREPEDSSLVEVSDDKGTHVVISAKDEDDALEIEGMLRRDAGAKTDKDERLSESRAAEREYKNRDPDQLRVRSGRVADKNEDREPEEDDDSVVEANHQSSSGGWWPFG